MFPGLTETSPAALFNMPGNTKYASVGVPASATRCKIVAINDSTGVGLQANQSGELWVKGPQNMLCYLNNKEATDEILIDGWIRTGDVAHYDEDGFVILSLIVIIIIVNGAITHKEMLPTGTGSRLPISLIHTQLPLLRKVRINNIIYYIFLGSFT